MENINKDLEHIAHTTFSDYKNMNTTCAYIVTQGLFAIARAMVNNAKVVKEVSDRNIEELNKLK